MKRILLFILTCALIIPVAAAEDSCANWARDEISQAAQLRIIPSEIQEFQIKKTSQEVNLLIF